jgi:hypothetical protein
MKRFFRRLSGSNNNSFITVVSGLPRSGTSMMMKMLEAGGIPPLTDQIRAADDDNPKGYYEFERVKKLPKGDAAWLPDAEGKAVKIISMLLTDLPEGYTYRVLFMRREMAEILASQRKMLVRRGEDPNKVSDDEMTMLYEKHLTSVYAWMNAHPNLKHMDIPYNEMLQDPTRLVPTVNKFLGGTLDTAQMMTVVDPKLYRQRAT